LKVQVLRFGVSNFEGIFVWFQIIIFLNNLDFLKETTMHRCLETGIVSFILQNLGGVVIIWSYSGDLQCKHEQFCVKLV